MRSLIAIFIACALVSTTIPSNAAGRLPWTENGPAAAVASTAWAGAAKAWAGAAKAWAGATIVVAGAATAVKSAATSYWADVTEQKKSAPDKAGSEPVQNKRTTIPD